MWKWNWPNIWLLMIFGMFRERMKNPKTRDLMKIWSRAWLVFGLFPRGLHIVDFFSAAMQSKFKEAIFCLLVVTLDMTTYLRNIIVEVHGNDFLKIIDYIDDLTRSTGEYMQEIVQEEITGRTKRCWAEFYLLTIQPFLFVVHFTIRPMIDAFIYNIHDGRIIDCYSYLPRDTWTQFWALWCFEAVHFLHSIYVCVAYEGLFITILEWILAHIELLKKELQFIDFRDDIRNVGEHRESTKTIKKQYDISIDQVVTHHQNILKVCLDLKDVSATVLVGNCIGSALVTMFTIYELTISFGELSQNKLVNLMEVGGGHLLHLFLLSFMCDELTFQCRELEHFIYDTEWYHGTKSQKAKLNIMLTITNQPMELGGFIIVNLANFIAIINGVRAQGNSAQAFFALIPRGCLPRDINKSSSVELNTRSSEQRVNIFGIMKTAFSYYNYLITVE